MNKRLICIALVLFTMLAVGCSSNNKVGISNADATANGINNITTNVANDAINESDAALTTIAVTGSLGKGFYESKNSNTNKIDKTEAVGKINNKNSQTNKTKGKSNSTTSATTTKAKDSLSEETTIKLGVDKKELNSTLTSPFSGASYKLKFIDDFNGTQLNLNNWNYYTRNYNAAEEQVNRKENVSVKDGNLIITALKETRLYTGDADSGQIPKSSYFTGGAINSENKLAYTYGRMEILAKLPYSYGMWSAFRTMGAHRGWPWGGEIDIMEFVGGIDRWNNYRDDEYISGVHYCKPEAAALDAISKEHKYASIGRFEIPSGAALGARIHDSWHVIGMEWTNKSISTYCDGIMLGELDITSADMREAFHKDHYLILNLVMGGSFAGTPNEKTIFPQEFKIDWVKVWQRA